MNIATSNIKGQIVIPKAVRESLGLVPKTNFNVVIKGNLIQLEPIREIITGAVSNEAFLSFLRENQGSWGPMTEKEKLWEKKRRAVELAASKRRKKAW